jgi:hypothetical protein
MAVAGVEPEAWAETQAQALVETEGQELHHLSRVHP